MGSTASATPKPPASSFVISPVFTCINSTENGDGPIHLYLVKPPDLRTHRACSAASPVYNGRVHRFFTPLLRRVYVFFAAFLSCYFAFTLAQRSPWNKERLYAKLLSGRRQVKLVAAAQ